MGPMAQDFREAFGLGTDDKTITQVDANGVTLAAIQGLNAKLEAQLSEERAARLAQAREISELRSHAAAEIAKLKLAIDVLLARTPPEGLVATAR